MSPQGNCCYSGGAIWLLLLAIVVCWRMNLAACATHLEQPVIRHQLKFQQQLDNSSTKIKNLKEQQIFKCQIRLATLGHIQAGARVSQSNWLLVDDSYDQQQQLATTSNETPLANIENNKWPHPLLVGNVSLTISWLKDGRLLDLVAGEPVSVVNVNLKNFDKSSRQANKSRRIEIKNTLNNGQFKLTSRLKLSRLKAHDSGKYKCLARATFLQPYSPNLVAEQQKIISVNQLLESNESELSVRNVTELKTFKTDEVHNGQSVDEDGTVGAMSPSDRRTLLRLKPSQGDAALVGDSPNQSDKSNRHHQFDSESRLVSTSGQQQQHEQQPALALDPAKVMNEDTRVQNNQFEDDEDLFGLDLDKMIISDQELRSSLLANDNNNNNNNQHHQQQLDQAEEGLEPATKVVAEPTDTDPDPDPAESLNLAASIGGGGDGDLVPTDNQTAHNSDEITMSHQLNNRSSLVASKANEHVDSGAGYRDSLGAATNLNSHSSHISRHHHNHHHHNNHHQEQHRKRNPSNGLLSGEEILGSGGGGLMTKENSSISIKTTNKWHEQFGGDSRQRLARLVNKISPTTDLSCYTNLGEDYRGQVATSLDSRRCLNWLNIRLFRFQLVADNKPNTSTNLTQQPQQQQRAKSLNKQLHQLHSHELTMENHNHCRNPNSDPLGPWCFVQYSEELDSSLVAPPFVNQPNHRQLQQQQSAAPSIEPSGAARPLVIRATRPSTSSRFIARQCNISSCSEYLWIYIVAPPIGLLALLTCLAGALVRSIRKSHMNAIFAASSGADSIDRHQHHHHHLRLSKNKRDQQPSGGGGLFGLLVGGKLNVSTAAAVAAVGRQKISKAKRKKAAAAANKWQKSHCFDDDIFEIVDDFDYCDAGQTTQSSSLVSPQSSESSSSSFASQLCDQSITVTPTVIGQQSQDLYYYNPMRSKLANQQPAEQKSTNTNHTAASATATTNKLAHCRSINPIFDEKALGGDDNHHSEHQQTSTRRQLQPTQQMILRSGGPMLATLRYHVRDTLHHNNNNNNNNDNSNNTNTSLRHLQLVNSKSSSFITDHHHLNSKEANQLYSQGYGRV